jgi:uncharacterized delta-60 repeat protein
MGRLKASLAVTSPVVLALLLARCVGSEPAVVPFDGSTAVPDSGPGKTDGGDGSTGQGDATLSDAKADTAVPDGGVDVSVADAGMDAVADTGFDAGIDATGICSTAVQYDGAVPGSLDPSFNNVVVPPAIGGPGVLLQDSLGRIYLAGNKTNCVSATSGTDFAVTRLNPNGTVDTTFGAPDAGTADAGFVASPGTVCIDFIGGADLLYAAALDQTGNIVVAGFATEPPPASPPNGPAAYFYTARVAVARLKADGTPDLSFNTTGKNRIASGPPEGQNAKGIAIDPTFGDIFIVGTTQALPVPPPGSATAHYTQLAGFVVKVSGADGTVASLWGSLHNGFEVDDNLSELQGATVSGGSLFVVGSELGPPEDGGATGPIPQRHFITRKYVVAGQGGLDTTFNAATDGGTLDAGTPGEVRTSPGTNDYAQSVVVDSQGRIVVAGFASASSPSLGGNGKDFDVYDPAYAAAVRYLPNGTLDGTFGTGGIFVSTELKGFPAYDTGMLALQCDDKVLLGALVDPLASIVSSGQSLAVLRLTSGGTPDVTYGVGQDAGAGISSLTLGGNSLVNALLIDNEQRLLIISGTGAQPTLTRFLP